MDRIDFLPLGSVIVVKGNVRKVLIIARGLGAKIGGEHHLFDYGGCVYPEGLVGDQIMYFNHKDIAKVVHKGYSDEDDEMMVQNINDWIETTNMKKGDPYKINEQNNRVNNRVNNGDC